MTSLRFHSFLEFVQHPSLEGHLSSSSVLGNVVILLLGEGLEQRGIQLGKVSPSGGHYWGHCRRHTLHRRRWHRLYNWSWNRNCGWSGRRYHGCGSRRCHLGGGLRCSCCWWWWWCRRLYRSHKVGKGRHIVCFFHCHHDRTPYRNIRTRTSIHQNFRDEAIILSFKVNACFVRFNLGQGFSCDKMCPFLKVPLRQDPSFHGRAQGGHSNHNVIGQVIQPSGRRRK
mmetsp:Transcript_130265/g.364520  ORF Transcript_130265/g.364520 Transcript_130265/m.364520 type:complete len:226 (+) Transcript_130265:54-731(+)